MIFVPGSQRCLKPSIDRVFQLGEAAEAQSMVEESKASGRVVLAVAGDGTSWDSAGIEHLD